MLAWLGDLNARERRTMGACFGGWALDAFNVQMYSFVIPTVIALWGLSRGEAALSDIIGHKWTFLLSAIGTLLMVIVYMPRLVHLVGLPVGSIGPQSKRCHMA